MTADPMTTAPAISVLMCVYNSERYLAEAVESILNQSFGDFEFLILDDGSQDRSVSILQAYAAQDSRIRLTRRENRGITKSMNELIAQAGGELIARMDADDLSLPDRFAQQVAFLQQHPEVVCLGGAQDWIDEAGRFLVHHPEVEQNAEIQQRALIGQTPISHPSVMMRRSALLQVGGYDETMVASSDLDLWLRLGEIGELANLPATVLQYRLHSSSITYAKQARQAADALAACQRAWKRRGIQGEFIPYPTDHLKQARFWLRCGWQGFMAGNRGLARRSGLRAVAIQPLSWESWNLLLCALLKPVPPS